MLGRSWVRVALVSLLAIAVCLVVRLDSAQDGSTRSQRTGYTVDVSVGGLRAISASIRQPMYWAGPKPGVTYELTRTTDRRTYVRYLPLGVAAGSPQPFLTVGTYPVANAFTVTRAAARGNGVVGIAIAGGGVAFYRKSRPTNVYLAFPGSHFQVEIYDPSRHVVRQLVANNRVSPLRSRSSRLRTRGFGDNAAIAISQVTLAHVVATLNRRIYWLGPIPGSTLELTMTPAGRVYIRYLPDHVAVGTRRPYLTVATYPLADAFAESMATAREPGTVRIPFGNGAIAFFARSRPTNIYLAFKGVNDQVEVYDPSARAVRALIARRRVRPVTQRIGT
jgi:hypothetical protein